MAHSAIQAQRGHNMTMTDDQRVKHLQALGINPDGKALSAMPVQPGEPAVPQHQPVRSTATLAAPGVDPHTMPVEDIVFDEALLDRFPSLAFNQDGAEAARYLFSLYKSPHKDPTRNGALQRKVSAFITNVRRSRETGGLVTETIKTSAAQRDIAATIATAEVSNAEVAEALRIREALKAAGVDIASILGGA